MDLSTSALLLLVIRAWLWTCSMESAGRGVLFSGLLVFGGGGRWGAGRALNRSLIRLICGALVYKPASPQSAQFNSETVPVGLLHPRVFLFPGAVEENKSAGKRREEREPRGSREAAAEPCSCGPPARAAFHLPSRSFIGRASTVLDFTVWRSCFQVPLLSTHNSAVRWTATQTGKFRAQQPQNEPSSLPRS